MSEIRIESIKMTNGLTLNLYDASRKVAADRWLVKLEARINITVTEDHFNNKVTLPAPLDQLRAKLGDAVTYTYQTERNFVDQRDKAAIFGQMQAGLLAKKPYYGHPDFAARYIIKEFARRRYLPDQNN